MGNTITFLPFSLFNISLNFGKNLSTTIITLLSHSFIRPINSSGV